MQPWIRVRVELFTRPFLPFLAPPIQEGSGNQTTGKRGSSDNTGKRGSSGNTGKRGSSGNTGKRGCSGNTGKQGNTGCRAQRSGARLGNRDVAPVARCSLGPENVKCMSRF